jgi:3-isopropylmalate/(R)-2-methylmalate dehydratase large subunit
VIVSGYPQGRGQLARDGRAGEKWSGIRIAIAASFAPIHARNNINQGVLMGDHDMLARLQAGEGIPLREFTRGTTRSPSSSSQGGLFPFSKALARGEIELPKPDTGRGR